GLREQLPGTQFLMYTMHDDDHRVFEALRAGANGYLLKSAGPDEVVQAVHEVLRGGAPMSAHVARRVVTHFQERSRPGN
ncbi:MAG: response regulator transcription factor, partial [Flavobacteriales bacterium]|nr:response regulator transcription factor [Flavobacteriales bacterium]